MMALTDADRGLSYRIVIEIVVLGVCVTAFTWQERRASDPMINFELWSHRPIAAGNAATLLAGMAMMCLTTFLPMYVQGVMQRSPIQAGLTLTMLMVGWPTGAIFASRSLIRVGLRRLLIGGTCFIPLGALAFVFLRPETSPLCAAIGSIVMGFGMGVTSVSCLVLIQEIVPPQERGSATASNLFARNLGNTLGAAVFGAVQNYGLAHVYGLPAVHADQLKRLLTGSARDDVAGNEQLRFVLHRALHLTFSAMLVVAMCACIAMLFMPAVKVNPKREPGLSSEAN